MISSLLWTFVSTTPEFLLRQVRFSRCLSSRDDMYFKTFNLISLLLVGDNFFDMPDEGDVIDVQKKWTLGFKGYLQTPAPRPRPTIT